MCSTKDKVRFKQDASVPFLKTNKFQIIQFLTFGLLLKATEELRDHLAKLRTMYGSCIKHWILQGRLMEILIQLLNS